MSSSRSGRGSLLEALDELIDEPGTPRPSLWPIKSSVEDEIKGDVGVVGLEMLLRDSLLLDKSSRPVLFGG
jgi:hypothetical protein